MTLMECVIGDMQILHSSVSDGQIPFHKAHSVTFILLCFTHRSSTNVVSSHIGCKSCSFYCKGAHRHWMNFQSNVYGDNSAEDKAI